MRTLAGLFDVIEAVTPYGGRRVIEILRGTVHGRIEGRILSGGADWQIIRSDGVADILVGSPPTDPAAARSHGR